jgi:hypothetical protein
MAQRRMFSLKIIDTDLFLDMPTSTQLLYFHLSMRADDDGFVAAPKKIIKIAGCNEDDMKILYAKQFILPFESGICVVRHWRIHNYIQKDRYQQTIYQAEKVALETSNNGSYEKCIQNVSRMDTQVRLGKVRLGKDNIQKIFIVKTSDKKAVSINALVRFWNSHGDLPKHDIKVSINYLKEKHKKIVALFSKANLIVAIDNYGQLMKNRKACPEDYWWTAKYDLWQFIDRENGLVKFIKYDEQNYMTKKAKEKEWWP